MKPKPSSRYSSKCRRYQDAEGSSADAAVLKLKSLEAFEKVADGQATTILLPAELQGIASVAETFKAAAGKKGRISKLKNDKPKPLSGK